MRFQLKTKFQWNLLQCLPNFNKLSYQLRIENIFDATWECYQRNEMTINKVTGQITVDFNIHITNMMGMNLDMSPIEVRIENQVYRDISQKKDTNCFPQILRCNLCESQQILLGYFAVVYLKNGKFQQRLFKTHSNNFQNFEIEWFCSCTDCTSGNMIGCLETKCILCTKSYKKNVHNVVTAKKSCYDYDCKYCKIKIMLKQE